MKFKTRYGLIDDAMKVYVDPNSGDKPAVLNYKGKEFDTGAFYCPYVPLQTGRSWNVVVMKGNRDADSRRWWRRLFDGFKPPLVFRDAIKTLANGGRSLMARMVFRKIS